ncbi:MAG: BMP family ABC transporter substrate-binding protein [Clostridia bacterium]|nr:BMP family ABC transporter substrate-binding protein [Clostridia bacterium]
MKKFLALFLALALCLSLMGAFAEAINPADIEDTITSADGTYEVAFVTDVGQLKDKSFNEGTWNGVKQYAYENNKTYKYYQPANGDQATDDDRYDAMKAAADAGAKVIVCAGFMQGTALEKAATEYPDVKFVFIDGWAYPELKNIVGIAFKEEHCGYFAGYAVVKDGFTKLGFAGGGGGTNPACMRYGYGFIQGANDAAKELGINVEIKFTWAYGATFSPSAELQTLMSGWYETGTEVVFSCGGSIFSSVVAAASAYDAYVIGVDVDQSYESDTVVTSALKGIGEGSYWAVGKVFDGTWDEIGGTAVSLGVTDNAVGLPVDTWSLEVFTVEEYEALMAKVASGEVVIDDQAAENDPNAKGPWSNVTVDYVQ